MEEIRNAERILVRNLMIKPSSRWEDRDKTDLQEIVFEGVESHDKNHKLSLVNR
jgi:hypothetical protein